MRAPTGASKRWPGWPTRSHKGMNRPFCPWRSSEVGALRRWGHELAPCGTHPIAAVEKEMAPPRRPRPQPCSAADRSFTAVNKRIRCGQLSAALGRRGQEGAPSRCLATLRRRKAASPMAPAQGQPPPSIAVAQAPRSLTSDARQALALIHGLGGLRALSRLLNRCGTPTMALRRPTQTQNANAVPRPGTPASLTCPWSPHGDQRHLRHAGWP